jgi:hypothetical protein
MIKHIVLIKLKQKQDTQRAIESLTNMKGKIEGMLEIEAGANILNLDRNFDVALTCVFKDKSALDVYQEHPVHVAVKDLFSEIVDKLVVVDYQL